MKIIKYKLELIEDQIIDVPAGSVILDIQLQHADDVVMWVWGDETQPLVSRQLKAAEDDGEVSGKITYIATVQTHLVKNTYHFFEKV